ncbi:uncharacterized protein BKA78DRAFT_322705 [Phyllosticta capitalensis]|uniref:uncharacterized protein n=1 Tax=Phyllosticta capitalensis TaxID=121624 RepID=UPI0031308053
MPWRRGATTWKHSRMMTGCGFASGSWSGRWMVVLAVWSALAGKSWLCVVARKSNRNIILRSRTGEVTPCSGRILPLSLLFFLLLSDSSMSTRVAIRLWPVWTFPPPLWIALSTVSASNLTRAFMLLHSPGVVFRVGRT